MDTRNYCVECDMPKPCECKEIPIDRSKAQAETFKKLYGNENK